MYNVSQAGNVLLRNIRRDISTEKTSLETDNSQIVKNNLITNNIFITLTICKQPLSAENNTIPETLQIFYSNYSVPSADDSNSNPINWDYGFASKNLTNYEENVLYIGVFAPTFNAEFAGDYNFQIGVSSKDTDNSTALFASVETFSDTNFDTSSYKLYYVEEPPLKGITKSLCAYQSAPQNTTAAVINFTSRGSSGTNKRMSLQLNNIANGTNYVAFVTQQQNQNLLRSWNPISFRTKPLAYAVPANPGIPVDRITKFYDELSTKYYKNFTNALDLFPCDNSNYSLVKNCSDCSEAYKDWICAVTIPRCADIELATRIIRNVNDSRVSEIDETMRPGPYIETPPCVDLCYNVSRSCPPIFNFKCPLLPNIANSSYGYMDLNSLNLNPNQNLLCNPMQNFPYVQQSMATRLNSGHLMTTTFWNSIIFGFIYIIFGFLMSSSSN
ncbi:264_t:CDS:2 [Entrophospora sp. SA101]|nr:264_t:CDS:2 [Entrophospora sp. SA101]